MINSNPSPLNNGTSFKNKFFEYVSDKVLDKNELKNLGDLNKNNKPSDSRLGDAILTDLSKYKNTTKMHYTFDPAQDVDFTFTPTYAEKDRITGRDMYQVISNISQNDTLEQTKSDGDRCAASMLVSAYLIMGGKFEDLAPKFGVGKDLTYENVHLLQDKVYQKANTDKEDGLNSGFKYAYKGSSKTITKVEATGEVFKIAPELNIKFTPIIGPSVDKLNQRKETIDQFFYSNPKGTLNVGVYLEEATGDILPPDKNLRPQNHAVLVFKKDEKFFMADSGKINNGDGNNIRTLANNEVDSLVYNTQGIVNSMTLGMA
ncbi:MAG: hypothetical protein ACK4IX_04660 [Candidatus Sericytochromatia bacterium]